MVGSATPGFAMRMLGCTGGQGWGTGLFVQLNRGPVKSWANRDPGAERQHRESTRGWTTAGCSASGFRGFFCVGLITHHFFKSDMYLCWMKFVSSVQGLKPVQKLKTKTESSNEQCPGVPNSHALAEAAACGCAFTHTGNRKAEHERKTTALSHKPELLEKRQSPFSKLTFGSSNYSQAVTFARDSVRDLGSELKPHRGLGHVLTNGKS